MARPEKQRLPAKDAETFKHIVKFYETKQYKKGLKAADKVLLKHPDHGETLAMKGLVLNCLDRKTEAYDHVKRGLRSDMRSHVCWHVYGLLYRSDRNYEQAIKSYKQALKVDSDNIQILRDLSLLQVQLRDTHGFLETRRKILTLKSTNKMHWIAYAVANHLDGKGAEAIRVIDAFAETLGDGQVPERSYEDSELALYRNLLLEEAGQFEDALVHLDSCKSVVVDGFEWRKKRAELLLYAGKPHPTGLSGVLERTGAIQAWVALMRQPVGADNYHFHRGLQCALLDVDAVTCLKLLQETATRTPTDAIVLSPDQVALLDDAYATLGEEFPRADAFAWVPLTYCPSGKRFEGLLDDFCRRFIKRGAPALGSALERLWAPQPGDVIEGRCRGAACCRKVLTLAQQHAEALTTSDAFADGSSTLPVSGAWALYLQAHCHEWLGELDEAMSVIQKAIDHTPTGVDFTEKRARLLKKVGRIQDAAFAMDAARKLDLADRYINNKCTKYMLRAGRVEDARATAALFTREEAGEPEQHLKDMQASWYELEVGAALARRAHAATGSPSELRELAGPALKLFLAVEKHFSDFVEDQFDFHTYCVRKMTLRAYVSVLKLEDNIRGSAKFVKACTSAAELYLLLHKADLNVEVVSEANVDPKVAKALAKREKAKRKKLELKKEQEAKAEAEKAKLEARDEATDKKKPPKRDPDEDPLGLKVAALSPLAEAVRLARALEKYASSSVETHALAFDVAMVRARPLLALRALRRLSTQSDPRAFVVRLARLCKARPLMAVAAPVAAVLDAELDDLCEGDAVAFLRAFAAKRPALRDRSAAARALHVLGVDDAALVAGADASQPDRAKPPPVADFEDALATLREVDVEAAEAFRTAALRRFPAADGLQ